MKNALLLTAPHEIDAHVRGLWRTDLFRESHDDPCGYIRNNTTNKVGGTEGG